MTDWTTESPQDVAALLDILVNEQRTANLIATYGLLDRYTRATNYGQQIWRRICHRLEIQL
jgi:hypothetical protein